MTSKRRGLSGGGGWSGDRGRWSWRRRMEVVLRVLRDRGGHRRHPHGRASESSGTGPGLGRLVLGLSAAGYPLTELAIRRLGRQGAILVETVCIGLTVRDAAMIGGGAPARLRRGPALLLRLELGVALAATGLGLHLAVDEEAVGPASTAPDSRELARRSAVGTLFALHTARFWIYLQPDHGLKPPTPGPLWVAARHSRSRQRRPAPSRSQSPDRRSIGKPGLGSREGQSGMSGGTPIGTPREARQKLG
jgi:hypothetical protein